MTLFKFFQKQDSVKTIPIDGTPSACDSAISKDDLLEKSRAISDSPMCLIDVRGIGIVTPIICSESLANKEFPSSTKKPKAVEISKKSLKVTLKEDCTTGKPPLASASRVVNKKDVDQSSVLQG